jgi:pimeloyl-ACP methyl ester carboxylesterase
LTRIVAAGAGTLAAAVATGFVVERRIVRARRAGAPESDELGSLRSDPVHVRTRDGITLHAEVDEVAPYANGAGAPSTEEATVVLVHGYALNLDCWHFQRTYFRGKRRVVLYDQRSHGRSERSPKENASIDELGHDLAAVLEQVVPDGPVVLVGHSMGGMAIMAFAQHHRELFGHRVVGAALVSTTAGGLRPHRVISSLIPDSVGGTVAQRLMAALSRAPELVDSARRRGSNIGFLVTDKFAFGEEVPASYVQFVDEMLARTSFAVLAEFFPHFEAHDKFEILQAFAAIPTSIICGTKDLLTSIGHSRKMAKQVPTATLVEVPGAGHMVIMERADKVNAALDELVLTAERRYAEAHAS